ncbi:MAG: DUF4038 domain-containing protein [Acidimicrobiales bacterium]
MNDSKLYAARQRITALLGAFFVGLALPVIMAASPGDRVATIGSDARILGEPGPGRLAGEPADSIPRALANADEPFNPYASLERDDDDSDDIDDRDNDEDDASTATAVPDSQVVGAGVANPSTTAPATTSIAPTTSRPAPRSNSSTATTAITTTTTTTVAPTTAAPTTEASTAAPPVPASSGSGAGATYIAPTAGTRVPVYDTAWQMLVRGTPAQADQYFSALKNNGFTGAWAGVIHHAPATYNTNFAGGGRVGNLTNGQVMLTPEYIAHVRSMLDAADRHDMKVGLVVAWQNLYLPGGGADSGLAISNQVRGTITTANAYAYGQHMVNAFGDHPAVSMWVFGGDAGTNNTSANIEVWRQMASGVKDAGSRIAITYHTPTSEFDQLNYAGEWWLDFVAPETGHAQDAATTEAELRTAKSVYGIPVWQGEPRYFNINFDWVNATFRNPGVAEVRADAQAAENAGVSGYVYGDAGRWTWCAGFGDSTPCNANNIAASFGGGEQAVIEVFRT